MKGVIAFLFFLLFLAGYALVSLRGGSVGSPATTDSAGDSELRRTRWRVVILSDTALVANSGVFVEFGDGNQLSGNGGCNFFNGSYERDAVNFRVSALRATRKACEPEVMRVEQLLFNALGDARSLALEGDGLRLQDESDANLLELEKSE